MSGRLPMCEQPGIAERLREIQAERMAAIAGPPPQPEPPSQMAATLEAMARARARLRQRALDALRQAGVPIREIGQSSNPTGASHDR